jgi:molecular chaperone GrpE
MSDPENPQETLPIQEKTCELENADIEVEGGEVEGGEKEKNEEEVLRLQRELEDYKNKYLYGLADWENSRKRMQKERQELTKFAMDNVILDLLKPLDQFERAMGFTQNMSEEVRNWAVGFQMILAQFKEALESHNIKAFHAMEETFDPHRHEAVEAVESAEHPEGTIVEVYTNGYQMGDRVIRAARVKVTKVQQDPAENTTQNTVQEVTENCSNNPS